MFHRKHWRGLFSKGELAVGMVMLTVKASDGEELSVPLSADADKRSIVETFRALTAACADYEASLKGGEVK